MALNVGPQPDGRLPRGAVSRMKEMGQWLKVYGEAVYGTRTCPPYIQEKFAFTKKNDTVYSFYLYNEDEPIKDELIIPYTDKKIAYVELMGEQSIRLDFKQTENGVYIKLPEWSRQGKTPIAHVFRMKL